MTSRVLLYFALLIVGGILSYKGLVAEKYNSKLSSIQMLLVFFLIFAMGLRMGMDSEIIQSIGVIGVKSGVFAVLTILGSVGVTFIFTSIFFKNNKINGRCKDDN